MADERGVAWQYGRGFKQGGQQGSKGGVEQGLLQGGEVRVGGYALWDAEFASLVAIAVYRIVVYYLIGWRLRWKEC